MITGLDFSSIAETEGVLTYETNNGDAAVTAQDARIALRTAAKLELVEGVFRQAADPDGNNTVTATDARKILRTAARLDLYPAI